MLALEYLKLTVTTVIHPLVSLMTSKAKYRRYSRGWGVPRPSVPQSARMRRNGMPAAARLKLANHAIAERVSHRNRRRNFNPALSSPL